MRNKPKPEIAKKNIKARIPKMLIVTLIEFEI